MSANTNPLKVFYCYAKEAKEDEELRDQLTNHLTPLRRERKLTIWLDVMIQAGSDWKLEVEKQLKEADIILLLISPDFMASDDCYNLQLMAFNYYEAGKVDIIPIILRPVLWEETPVKRLPIVLPTSKIPVSLWPNHDQALMNVAAGIRDVIQAKLSNTRSLPSKEIDILNQLGKSVFSTQCPKCGTLNRIGAKFCKNDGTDLVSRKMIVIPKPVPPIRTKESWIEEGNILYKHGHYIDALVAYQQALQLNPNDVDAHCKKGNTFWMLHRYPEALTAYEEALQLDPGYARAYNGKGNVFYDLHHYPEALTAYEAALRLNSNAVDTHCNKGNVFYDLHRYLEALEAYEEALQLDPGYARAYNGKGDVFYDLHCYPEALTAYEQALQLNPSDADTHCNKGHVLRLLHRYLEALEAYEEARQLDPGCVRAYNGKGNVFYDLHCYPEALTAYEAALRLNPNAAAIYYNKGNVFYNLHRYPEALTAYEEARQLDPVYFELRKSKKHHKV